MEGNLEANLFSFCLGAGAMTPSKALLGARRTWPQGWVGAILQGKVQLPKPDVGSQPNREPRVWLGRTKALKDTTTASWALNLTAKVFQISAGYADALFSHGLKSICGAALHIYYSSCTVTTWASACKSSSHPYKIYVLSIIEA